MSDNNNERLEAYLRGSLPPEEARQLEQEFQSNPALMKEFRMLQLEFTAIKGSIRQRAQTELASWNLQKKVAARRRNRLILAVLSGVVAITLGYFIWQFIKPADVLSPVEQSPIVIPKATQEATPDSLIEQNQELVPKNRNQENSAQNSPLYALADEAEHFYESPVLFGSNLKSEAIDTTKTREFESLYRQQRFDELLKQLERAPYKNSEIFRYPRAHIYFRTGRYKDAVREFKLLAQNKTSPSAEDARWYLLLSYLAAYPENRTQALAFASEMADDPYNARQSESAEILDMMKAH